MRASESSMLHPPVTLSALRFGRCQEGGAPTTAVRSWSGSKRGQYCPGCKTVWARPARYGKGEGVLAEHVVKREAGPDGASAPLGHMGSGTALSVLKRPDMGRLSGFTRIKPC